MKREHTQSGEILLIEDDPNLGIILQESLELQGYEVALATDGEAGSVAFMKNRYVLVLIDVMLPKKDGFTLAREIREADQEVPIIFLTAKSLREDKIQGLTIGADDYITKPFSMEELLLRIKAVLKRSGTLTQAPDDVSRFEIGVYQFDYTTRRLCIGDQERTLTHKEAELLRLFCLHMNEIVDRDTALRRIWRDDSVFASRSMDVYISKLRKYLHNDNNVDIVNVHGVGYKLSVRC